MGKKVMDFLKSNLAYMNPNMWRADYYFIPPCTFYEFTLYEVYRNPGWVLLIRNKTRPNAYIKLKMLFRIHN